MKNTTAKMIAEFTMFFHSFFFSNLVIAFSPGELKIRFSPSNRKLILKKVHHQLRK